MIMALVEAQTASDPVKAGVGKTVCRCGHCRVMIDLPDGARRVRCRSCGWSNAVPNRVYTTCERCEHEQHVRFSRRDGHCLCVNCGYTLNIREIELAPMRRRSHRRAHRPPRSQRRESIIFTLLLYAFALLVALFWFSRR